MQSDGYINHSMGVLAAPRRPGTFMNGIPSLSNYPAIDVTILVGIPERPETIARDLKFPS